MNTDHLAPIEFKAGNFTKEDLIGFYDKLLLPRIIEERMLILLRQGKISKWFSGYGQEAVSVGAAMAMKEDEIIFPMHRNLGMFTTRGVPLEKLFAQFQGKSEGFTKGRDRSFHFGTKEHNMVGMISHLGPQMGLADGVALAEKLSKSKKCTLVVTGDGGASEGDFHEALNVAAVWDLPVIFLVENNKWGLSTPSHEQFRCEQFIDKAIGYGIEGVQVDGNNILEVYSTVNKIAEDIRNNPRPILLEAMTFRMRGHEEASGTAYYPEGIQEEWKRKDPVDTFENWLTATHGFSHEELSRKKVEVAAKVKAAFNQAYDLPDIKPNREKEEQDVFAPFHFNETTPAQPMKEMRFIDAISDGLKQAMIKHPNLILMGQDIGAYGGVFKVTDKFSEQFGKERVRNTPLCESAIVGAGLGLSIKGYKAMVEMQFADFVTEGFNQIVNNLAKMYYRWGQNADVVVRMPTGAGVAAGPYHSQSNEAWFFHVPGLKIAYPSTPEDAKGLLLTAFEDPNPVMFFEHKALYRSLTTAVPEGYYTLPFGKARVVKEGTRLSIVTYGMGVHWANAIAEEQVGIEVIDLRSLSPLDTQTVFDSVKKTGKALVLHEDNLTGGIGGELSALITENCFEYLDAPVMRCASLDTPIPFHAALEQQFLANSRLKETVEKLLAY